MRNVLIVAATSAIAEQYARIEAARGSHLTITGRSEQRLHAIASDLLVRGAGAVRCVLFDINQRDKHAEVICLASERAPLDVILIAHGTLPSEEQCAGDVELAVREFETNATSTIALMVASAHQLRTQKHGTLAVISSVAGDRGRASNALYGSAKAAVSAFASGLRQQLHVCGANVLTVKPGWVETPMTAAFPKNGLWAAPRVIATVIDRGIRRRRSIVYAPGYWRVVMLVIKLLPEPIFRRIRL